MSLLFTWTEQEEDKRISFQGSRQEQKLSLREKDSFNSEEQWPE